jgi:hypothetical protein
MGEEKEEEDQVGPDDGHQGDHGRGGGSSNHGQPQQADDSVGERAGWIARVASGGSTSSASGRKSVLAAAPLDPQRTRRPSIDQMQNITAAIHPGIARTLSGEGSGPRRSRRPSVDGSGGVGLIARLGSESDSGSRHSMIAKALSGEGSGPRRSRRPSVDGSGGVGLIARLSSGSGHHAPITGTAAHKKWGRRQSRDMSDDETFSVGSEDVFSRTGSGESRGSAERGVGGARQSRRKSSSFDAEMSGPRRSRRQSFAEMMDEERSGPRRSRRPSFAEMMDEERSGPRRSRRPSLFDQPAPTLPPPPSQQEMEEQVHEAIVRSQMEACADPAQKQVMWEEYQQGRRARLGGGEQPGGSDEDVLQGEAGSVGQTVGGSPDVAESPTMMPRAFGGTPTAGPLGAEDGFAARLEKVRFREACACAQARACALVEAVLPR